MRDNRIVWLDVLRLVAILMVIVSHSVDALNMSSSIASGSSVNWGAAIGSAVRACVPLFAMMTGVLLLPVSSGDVVSFYKKRIPRVLFPLLIWSTLYNLFPLAAGFMGADEALLGRYFPAVADSGSFAVTDVVKNIVTTPLGFSLYNVHMWYIYMLIGLYLFMPFFFSWLGSADNRTIRIYLAIWGVTLFLPYVYQLFSPFLLGRCDWNDFGTLYYFAGFSGYMVLGYYLRKPFAISTLKTVIIGSALFVAGYAITFAGFDYYASRYSYSEFPQLLEMFWQFCSPNVVMMTAGVFIIIQRVEVRGHKMQKLLGSITECGLGIYLAHYLFIYPFFSLSEMVGLPLFFQEVVIVAGVFFCSWGTTLAIKKLLGSKAKIVIG